ncbi:nucleotidyltransferase domain-containing protein [Thermoproteota archaeon]
MKPKDRDFIQTVDDHLFCVVGYLHPSDCYTAYLKYVPSPDGKWGKDGQRYSRTLPFYHVSQVENTYRYLKEKYPQYLYDCPVRNITISWVPKSHVKQYYHPRKKLHEIGTRGANDLLEQKLLNLTVLLEKKLGIKNSLGVTGSILTGIHNPSFSDIDLTVHGYDASRKLIEVLRELKEETDLVKPVTPVEKEGWVKTRAERFPLSVDDLRHIAEKRWNYGYIEGTYFSVHPTRTDEEITEDYGDNTYHRKKVVEGTATVSDNRDSIYIPAVYGVEDSDEVSEVVSFEGLYESLFEVGDRIRFKGVLEEIRGKDPRYRVLVGGAGSPDSYIKWV